MSTFRICPHGEPERSCPICAPALEPRPIGLYQFAPASGRVFLKATDPLANALAAARYIEARYPAWLLERAERRERWRQWATTGRVTMGEKIKASFNHGPEWVADVLRDRDEIEGELVRLTKRRRPILGGTLWRLEVMGTAIVRGRVVELTQIVGDLGWTEEKDAEVHERADEVIRPLEEELAGAGLEVRAGSWEYV